MKIKQVEELVGITKKNIRFYEEQGLLKVERAENGYREYGLQEVKRLQEIKLLRKLSVPIEDMRQIFKEEKSLKSCLEYQVEEMERKKRNLTQIQSFCEDLLAKKTSFQTLQAVQCLEKMEQLEKEGMQFMDVGRTDVHKKKIIGTVVSGGIMLALMVLSIIAMFWGNTVDPIPGGVLACLIGLSVVVIIGVIAVIIGRIREIRGGEEDEASKY